MLLSVLLLINYAAILPISTATGRPGLASVVAEQVTIRLLESSRLGATWNNNEPVLIAQPVPRGSLSLGFASAISSEDNRVLIESGAACGGLLDEAASENRRLIASLPDSPVESEGDANAESDIVLRMVQTDESSYVVLVNASPWPRVANVTIEAGERSLATLVDNDQPGAWCGVGRHAMTTELPPHAIRVWNFDSPKIKALGIRTEPRPDASQELLAALEEIKSRDRTARKEFLLTPNASFESRDLDGQALGWTYGDKSPSVEITAPESGASEGTHALLLEAGQNVVSDLFPQPVTGQYVLLFQAQANGLREDSSLRLDIESADGEYRVHTLVQSAQLLGGDSPTWRPVIFGVDDLPLAPGSEMLIRFTLVGEGSVWIDNLQCESLILPVTAYGDQLQGQKLALVKLVHDAETALDEGRLAACRDLLDSYWMRFIAEHFPVAPVVENEPTAESLAVDETPESIGGDLEPEEESPSMGERVRGWFWR